MYLEENEFAIDDPKLKAMMKKLKKNAQNSVKQEATTKPPKSFEEYLAIEHVVCSFSYLFIGKY